MHISKALKAHNHTKFEELIEKSGLTDEIDQLSNATIFAPKDSAFEDENTKKMLNDIENDKEKIKQFVMYHVAQGQLPTCDFENNEMIESKTGESFRINLYSTVSSKHKKENKPKK